jgi:enoyl-CoA hydratase
MQFPDLSFSIRESVAEIVLSRPESRNCFTYALMEQFITLLAQLAGRDDVRAMLIAGAGKTFSAGGNFDLIMAEHGNCAGRDQVADLSRRYFTSLVDCPYPIVAAVHGDAIGAGATLALCCDAIVCSRTARIADPHVMIGLAAGDGGAVLWPSSIGLLRARRYLLTGDRLTGEQAHAMGLVSDLVDTPEDVLPAARALAERMAALPPKAVQATKKALVQGLRHRINEVFELALALEMETFSSHDVLEAISALRERRTPRFQGR